MSKRIVIFLDVQQITCLAYLQLKVEIQMLLDSVKQQGYLKDLPEDIKRDLVGFWSNVLESNLFYEVPLEFHQMCYELGQYRIAQDRIKAINMAAKKMDNSDTFVDTWRAMMESNYLKEAQPHEGSYHMHLNELLVNVTACLENWVDEYVPTHKKEIQQYFYGDLNKRLQESYDEFLKTTQSE